RAAESLLSGRIQEREYRGRTEMSRKIYNRLSLMAVSWLDESTLPEASYNLATPGQYVPQSLSGSPPAGRKFRASIPPACSASLCRPASAHSATSARHRDLRFLPARGLSVGFLPGRPSPRFHESRPRFRPRHVSLPASPPA